MATFLVEVLYNPGTPKMYIAEGKTHREARDHVVNNIIMYDPGVPIRVTQTPINKGEVVTFQ